MAPLASIAIATWNRCNLLAELILSLENQTLPRDDYVINVYDSSSPDGTRQVVEELAAIYDNIHYINVDVNSPAHKRNVAISETTTPIIIFMDDDMLAYPQLVDAHVRAQKSANGVAYCGQVRFPTRLVQSSNYFRFRDSRHLGPMRSGLDLENLPFQFIVIMNMSAKVEELRSKVGLFSEDFRSYACEDYEYGYRLAKAGIRMAYLEDALAIHREASHGVAVFSNKLRSMARESVPVLKQLVPAEELAGRTFDLEPITPAEELTTRLRKQLAQGMMNRQLAHLIQRYLEMTDKMPFFYSSALYQYLLAEAYYEGVQQRPQENQAQFGSTGAC